MTNSKYSNDTQYDPVKAARTAGYDAGFQAGIDAALEALPEIEPRPQGFGYNADLQFNEGLEMGARAYKDQATANLKALIGGDK